MNILNMEKVFVDVYPIPSTEEYIQQHPWLWNGFLCLVKALISTQNPNWKKNLQNVSYAPLSSSFPGMWIGLPIMDSIYAALLKFKQNISLVWETRLLESDSVSFYETIC